MEIAILAPAMASGFGRASNDLCQTFLFLFGAHLLPEAPARPLLILLFRNVRLKKAVDNILLHAGMT